MRFRTVAVAAVILLVCSVGAFAAMQIADDARGESAQNTIEASDSLAVEPDLRQRLQADSDHNPTAYGETVDVTYEGEEWTEGEEYEYYPETGEIEFLEDRDEPADIEFSYEIPENEVADDQLQTVVSGNVNVLLAGVGVAERVGFIEVGGLDDRQQVQGRQERGAEHDDQRGDLLATRGSAGDHSTAVG